MESIGLEIYRVPGRTQYVAPQGYAFYYNGEYQGRIIWRKPNQLDGYYIDKDKE